MICTVTVNPAIDRILYIKEFTPNRTTRVKEKKDVLGGKGTHVSVNLGLLKCKNRAFGIDFGTAGLAIEKMLESEYVEMRFLHYDEGESRTNYAMIEENLNCTLVTEKGKIVSKEICEELMKRITEETKAGDILILSGDASNTEVPHMYNMIMEELADKGVRFFLDSSADNLIEGLKRKPFLIKPNEDELEQILGKPLPTEADLLGGIKEVAAMGIPCIALTCGGNGSYVYYDGQMYRIEPLKLDVKNTIGCGDAFLSGIAYGFDNELPFEEILRFASAVSSATAESNSTVGYDPERVKELLSQVVIKKIEA